MLEVSLCVLRLDTPLETGQHLSDLLDVHPLLRAALSSECVV